MPCYSNVVETKMTEADRLVKALTELGIKVTQAAKNLIQTTIGNFSRQSNGSFAYQGTNDISQVGRKYAELTVRAWQQKNGYSVAQFAQNRKFVLQKN